MEKDINSLNQKSKFEYQVAIGIKTIQSLGLWRILYTQKQFCFETHGIVLALQIVIKNTMQKIDFKNIKF